MSTTLYATIRPAGDLDAEPTSIQATGEDYEAARIALEQQVPDGWQLLGISYWPA